MTDLTSEKRFLRFAVLGFELFAAAPKVRVPPLVKMYGPA